MNITKDATALPSAKRKNSKKSINISPSCVFFSKYGKRGIFMFVRSVKMSTIKLVSIAALAIIATIALIIFIPSESSAETAATPVGETKEIRFDKIKTESDRTAFLSQFGYTVKDTPIECVEVKIPKEFDKVFAAYNELQKAEGLDLSRYRGKTVMRYTYEVTNYPSYDGDVLASLLVYKNKVIGGDVCSKDPSGFAHGFTKK